MSSNPWTKPYRDVVELQFRLSDEARQEVDGLFLRIDALAAQSPDQMTFINQFMASPLYAEYSQLFQKYQGQMIGADGQSLDDTKKQMEKEAAKSGAKEYVKSMATIEAKAAISHMLPDEVNRLRWGGLRVVPVIGPIIQWMDNIQWLRRLLGSKKN